MAKEVASCTSTDMREPCPRPLPLPLPRLTTLRTKKRRIKKKLKFVIAAEAAKVAPKSSSGEGRQKKQSKREETEHEDELLGTYAKWRICIRRSAAVYVCVCVCVCVREANKSNVANVENALVHFLTKKHSAKDNMRRHGGGLWQKGSMPRDFET